MIAYLYDVPISEMTREDLEAALADAHRQITLLHNELGARSIAHINDLAKMRRAYG